jgi:hypothetical protein
LSSSGLLKKKLSNKRKILFRWLLIKTPLYNL